MMAGSSPQNKCLNKAGETERQHGTAREIDLFLQWSSSQLTVFDFWLERCRREFKMEQTGSIMRTNKSFIERYSIFFWHVYTVLLFLRHSMNMGIIWALHLLAILDIRNSKFLGYVNHEKRLNQRKAFFQGDFINPDFMGSYIIGKDWKKSLTAACGPCRAAEQTAIICKIECFPSKIN